VQSLSGARGGLSPHDDFIRARGAKPPPPAWKRFNI